MRNRVTQAVAALAALAAAIVALFGLPGGSSGPATGLTALADAAEHTASYPGARMTFVGRFGLPGSGEAMTFEGAGVYNSAGRTRMTMEAIELPPAAAATFPGGFELEQVMETGPNRFVMYMRSPAFTGALPDGREWMRLDLSEQTPDSMTMDLRATMRQLRSVADVETLGEETIRGAQTTHYGATVDQQEEVERLRGEGEDAAADALEQAIAVSGDTLDVELWVDADDLIHRMEMAIPFELGTAGTAMEMTMDFTDYGIDPAIELPSENAVFDATELATGQAGTIAG